MADQAKSDMVMRFVAKASATTAGGDVLAESALDVVGADPFMHGFKPAPYQDYSNFFEVQTFTFDMQVTPQDQDVGALSHSNTGVPIAKDQFSRWRSATTAEAKLMRYPIDFQKFSFTRIIDSASISFFNAVVNQVSFKSATLVKRVSAAQGTQQMQMGYLRFEFHDVLLTSFEWNDGDLVTETCEFICKRLKIRYRRQRANNQLSEEVPPVEWDQKKNGEA